MCVYPIRSSVPAPTATPNTKRYLPTQLDCTTRGTRHPATDRTTRVRPPGHVRRTLPRNRSNDRPVTGCGPTTRQPCPPSSTGPGPTYRPRPHPPTPSRRRLPRGGPRRRLRRAYQRAPPRCRAPLRRRCCPYRRHHRDHRCTGRRRASRHVRTTLPVRATCRDQRRRRSRRHSRRSTVVHHGLDRHRRKDRGHRRDCRPSPPPPTRPRRSGRLTTHCRSVTASTRSGISGHRQPNAFC